MFSVKRGLLQACTIFTSYFSFDSFLIIVHNENESISEASYKILLFYLLVPPNLNRQNYLEAVFLCNMNRATWETTAVTTFQVQIETLQVKNKLAASASH